DLFCRWEIFHIWIPSVPTACIIHMCINPGDILDDSSIFPRFELEVVCFGMPLVTHLGDHLTMLSCFLHHQFYLPECLRHRLLDIYVLAQLQSRHGYREMGKIRRTDRNRVNLIAHFVEHFPKILKTRNVWKHL